MSHLLKSIGRWLDKSDAGDLLGVMFGLCLVIMALGLALAIAIHGLPEGLK